VATARNPPLIALTGGVAAGKSTAARAFEALRPGCLVDADAAARAVVAPGSEGLAAVVAAFGPGVLATDGTLDRAALRQRVFAEPEARRRLEALLHPRIRAWMLAAAAQGARLLARDGIDAGLAEAMIAAQASRAERLALADDVLVNLGTPADLAAAVARLDAGWASSLPRRAREP
jgi:dephospho-CoA kinase